MNVNQPGLCWCMKRWRFLDNNKLLSQLFSLISHPTVFIYHDFDVVLNHIFHLSFMNIKKGSVL